MTLTKGQLKERALKAALSRWDESIIVATHGKDDHPLIIGNIKIPCFVLSDGTRVLLQKEMALAIGMSSPNSSQISEFTKGKALSPFFRDKNIGEILSNPIKFRKGKGKGISYGYDATILADICDAVLEARKQGALLKSQENIALQCEILMRGFARIGIIALIDEATGYQNDRVKNALSKILEAFIAKELQPYMPTFPVSFYEELFRLRGLNFSPESVKRPQYFGCITNNIIYERLAPGIKEELKKELPKNKNGKPKACMFQKLTTDNGYIKLRELLGSVISIMKLSKTWEDFMENINKIHPRFSDQYLLPIGYDPKKDTGKGF